MWLKTCFLQSRSDTTHPVVKSSVGKFGWRRLRHIYDGHSVTIFFSGSAVEKSQIIISMIHARALMSVSVV